MAGIAFVVAALGVVLILSALLKRRVIRAGVIMLVLTAAMIFVGLTFMRRAFDKEFPALEIIVAIAALVFAGRRPQAMRPQNSQAAVPSPQPTPQPIAPAPAVPQPLPPVDEVAFQAWLSARGLLNKSHSPAEMLDLRRQFAGVA